MIGFLTALANVPLWLRQVAQGAFIAAPLLLATAWLVWTSKRWFPDPEIQKGEQHKSTAWEESALIELERYLDEAKKARAEHEKLRVALRVINILAGYAASDRVDNAALAIVQELRDH